MSDTVKKGRGRPSIGEAAKRHALGIRTTRETKDRIEAAALASGRSVAQEVEHRLERSFRDDDANGGSETNALLKLIGAMITVVETRTRALWYADTDTFFAVEAAIKSIMRQNFPSTWEGWTPEVSAALGAQNEAEETLRAQQAALNSYRDEHPELRWHVPIAGEVQNALAPLSPHPTQDVLLEHQRLVDELLEAVEETQAALDAVQRLTTPIYDRQERAERMGQEIGNNLSEQFRVSRQQKA